MHVQPGDTTLMRDPPVNANHSLLRNINRLVILDYLRVHGPASRAQIARALGVSQPTVGRLADELRRDGLVEEAGTLPSDGGRPATLLRLAGQQNLMLGVDLGGTRIFGALANLQGEIQAELEQDSRATPVSRNSLERLVRLIRSLLDEPRPGGQVVRGIGLGVPGVTHAREGVVVWAPSLGWRDLPLKELLEQEFGLPSFVENDVNLAALGEAWFGAGRGVRNLAVITVGTGIGAGLIIDGALYRGPNDAAGEVGYMLPDTSHLGREDDSFGALESLASGTGIAERAARVHPQGKTLAAKEVFEAARDGETWAREVVAQTVDLLALAIANLSAILNPELVVLGGGVANSSDLLIEPIRDRLRGVVPYPPEVVPSRLGRRAAVAGAVAVVLHGTEEHVTLRRLP